MVFTGLLELVFLNFEIQVGQGGGVKKPCNFIKSPHPFFKMFS